jgi:hypothetical protein
MTHNGRFEDLWQERERAAICSGFTARQNPFSVHERR